MYYAKTGKRILDIVGAFTGLVLMAPLLFLTAIVVRVHFGSPVMFRQLRPGLNNRLFTILKFRTMCESVGENGTSLPDEVRLTNVGQLLRATSVDELPELWNVLKGDMSLVGPRPLLPEYLTRYSAQQARRHEVRPGITGLAQINGRNELEWKQRFELDVRYVDNISFVLDAKILMKTIIRTVQRRGISQAGRATAQEFTGS